MATSKAAAGKPAATKTAMKKPPVKAPAKKASMGLQIDALCQLREKLREIQAQEKTQLDLISAAETVLMETMKSEGIEKSTGKMATVFISSTVSANVVDWDVFYAYIYKNKFAHLLQKRVSDPAVRELFETKGQVPGVEPFTKEKLNIRKT
jgi:hypothetical protein